MKKLVSLALVLVMILALVTSCTPPVDNRTVLRMATGYNNANTAITFRPESEIGEGITLANGKEYHVGDLKPTWEALEAILNVKFDDQFTGAGSAEKEFNVWAEKLDQIDMVAGSVSKLNEAGAAGKLIDLGKYLDRMPNFKAYLEANPIVRLSITGDTANGAIYFSPYFDGVNDIERMPLMRTDWVEKLLNGEGAFKAEKSNTLKEAVYQPYMPTSGTVEVDVVNAAGTAVEKITKDYSKYGNIVKKMNDAGTLTGVQAVNMLREYIDKTYNGYYGTNRADLFIGQNAAWDADELVALLRCVVANPQTLNGKDVVQGLFAREDDNNQRRVDVFRFTGTLFGVRGLESRQDYLYVGNDGKLHDARGEAATYEAIARVNAMAQEGLLSESFMLKQDTETKVMLQNDAGFMHYDYNQTQTALNEKNLQAGEKYMAVMVPVARWNDGEGEKYMRFTESWRSVKTDGWALSKEGIGNDTAKLDKALALIDYAYSPKGQILMSYGPDEFIKRNADGSYVTFDFNGQQWPVIADATFEELWTLAAGNYTNYARYYLGSTLSFVKSQSFEYQCTHAVGKEGAGKISKAIALGTIKHPELALTENPWYTSVPTVLPTTKEENDIIGNFTNLASNGKFSQSKNQENLLIDLIVGKEKLFDDAGNSLIPTIVEQVSGEWGSARYVEVKNNAWDRLQAFYENLNK